MSLIERTLKLFGALAAVAAGIFLITLAAASLSTALFALTVVAPILLVASIIAIPFLLFSETTLDNPPRRVHFASTPNVITYDPYSPLYNPCSIIATTPSLGTHRVNTHHHHHHNPVHRPVHIAPSHNHVHTIPQRHHHGHGMFSPSPAVRHTSHAVAQTPSLGHAHHHHHHR